MEPGSEAVLSEECLRVWASSSQPMTMADWLPLGASVFRSLLNGLQCLLAPPLLQEAIITTAFSVLGPPCWDSNPVPSHGAVHTPLKPRPLGDALSLLSPPHTSHIPHVCALPVSCRCRNVVERRRTPLAQGLVIYKGDRKLSNNKDQK